MSVFLKANCKTYIILNSAIFTTNADNETGLLVFFIYSVYIQLLVSCRIPLDFALYRAPSIKVFAGLIIHFHDYINGYLKSAHDLIQQPPTDNFYFHVSSYIFRYTHSYIVPNTLTINFSSLIEYVR